MGQDRWASVALRSSSLNIVSVFRYTPGAGWLFVRGTSRYTVGDEHQRPRRRRARRAGRRRSTSTGIGEHALGGLIAPADRGSRLDHRRPRLSLDDQRRSRHRRHRAATRSPARVGGRPAHADRQGQPRRRPRPTGPDRDAAPRDMPRSRACLDRPRVAATRDAQLATRSYEPRAEPRRPKRRGRPIPLVPPGMSRRSTRTRPSAARDDLRLPRARSWRRGPRAVVDDCDRRVAGRRRGWRAGCHGQLPPCRQRRARRRRRHRLRLVARRRRRRVSVWRRERRWTRHAPGRRPHPALVARAAHRPARAPRALRHRRSRDGAPRVQPARRALHPARPARAAHRDDPADLRARTSVSGEAGSTRRRPVSGLLAARKPISMWSSSFSAGARRDFARRERREAP
ncbi:MAG: hypothetical protein MZV70_45415 [Desulfobacterales bacterium]|nr:hypothetical protein [Desulfobacterales bacterium]